MLFNLAGDPFEQVNLIRDSKAINELARLDAELNGYIMEQYRIAMHDRLAHSGDMSQDPGFDRAGMDEAIDLLTEMLSQGPLLHIEIKNAASEFDISGSTLKRGKKKLGVKSRRITSGNQGRGHWEWYLP